MANNLPTKKPNASLALKKAKSRIDIVNKLLAKKKDDLISEELNYRLYVGMMENILSLEVKIKP